MLHVSNECIREWSHSCNINSPLELNRYAVSCYAGCFVYYETTPLSVVQDIVLVPNLLRLQWGMGGSVIKLSSPQTLHSKSSVTLRMGNTFSCICII
jgi:hypothetical protein